jgi:hypothetical protein
MLVTRKWLHFKNLRCAGRFLKSGGAKATQSGELAILCRSCPIDGVNMVKDWRLRPADKQCVLNDVLTSALTALILDFSMFCISLKMRTFDSTTKHIDEAISTKLFSLGQHTWSIKNLWRNMSRHLLTKRRQVTDCQSVN